MISRLVGTTSEVGDRHPVSQLNFEGEIREIVGSTIGGGNRAGDGIAASKVSLGIFASFEFNGGRLGGGLIG